MKEQHTKMKENYIQVKKRGIKNHAEDLTRLNGEVDGRRKSNDEK